MNGVCRNSRCRRATSVLELAGEGLDLEAERAGEAAERRDADLDDGARPELGALAETIVLDEAAQLAHPVEGELGKQAQAVQGAPAEVLLERQQRTLARAQGGPGRSSRRGAHRQRGEHEPV